MNKDFGMVFWIHFVLIIILWLSPLWADWFLILLGIIALHIYWFIFQGCHLTKLEAGNGADNTFYYFYLSKYFKNLDKKKVKLFVRWVMPAVLLFVAYFIQEFIGSIPIVNL